MLLGLALALQVGLMLAAAPVLAAWRRRVQARLVGQAGPSLAQDWRALRRLLRKHPVVAEGASFVFFAGPVVDFAAALAAAALVPGFLLGTATAPAADLIVIAFLLALGRAARALAAMDAGMTVGGMGAGGAMRRAVLADPALLLGLLAMALSAGDGGSNPDAIARQVLAGTAGAFDAARALALAALAVVGVALTRPEPGLAGELSGWQLALAAWAEALRALVWLALILALFLPFGAVDAAGLPLLWPLAAALWAAKLAALALLLALVETAMADLRLERLLGAAAVLGWLAVVLVGLAQRPA